MRGWQQHQHWRQSSRPAQRKPEIGGLTAEGREEQPPAAEGHHPGSSVSNAGVAVIPTQFKVTQQILINWQPFRDLKLKFVGSRRQEQLSSRCQQRVVATVEESVLRTEMAGLEPQEEDAPKSILFYKPMSWLEQIRTHRRDESWSVSLW